MSDVKRPYVAVVGGLRGLSGGDLDGAISTANAIGAALAKDFGLVVFDSDKSSVEPYLVAGFCAGLGESERPVSLIHIYAAQSQIETVKYDQQVTFPQVFELHIVPNDDWQAGFFRTISGDGRIEALILIGGGPTTFAAGQIALARGLPVAAVSKFGGAAAKIWTDLARRQEDGRYPVWTEENAPQLADYLKRESGRIREKNVTLAKERDYIASLQARLPFTIATLCVGLLWLLALLVGCGLAESAGTARISLLSSLILGGATGALLRSMIWGGEDVKADVLSSLTAGGIAGLIVGIAYLVPILQGTPGVFTVGDYAILSSDRILILSTALVSVGAGVGFDVIFRRMKDGSSDLPISSVREKSLT